MNSDIRNTINDITEQLDAYRRKSEMFSHSCDIPMPSREVVISIIKALKEILLPGYFGKSPNYSYKYFTGDALTALSEKLVKQIQTALCYNSENTDEASVEDRASDICRDFISKLPDIQVLLTKDIEATFDGDPAAHGFGEIISSYPGILAMLIYRTAHILYINNVPVIPRMMTEYAHSRTGIDINAGAEIGEYFCIDHGTGIVIGETTVIGNHVKIYQGVTLGALSTRMGNKLSGVKRHPTIGNNVTLYSGSTILGGETIIGDNVIIGGNAFITKSVPPYTKVTIKAPELVIKPGSPDGNGGIWEI